MAAIVPLWTLAEEGREGVAPRKFTAVPLGLVFSFGVALRVDRPPTFSRVNPFPTLAESAC